MLQGTAEFAKNTHCSADLKTRNGATALAGQAQLNEKVQNRRKKRGYDTRKKKAPSDYVPRCTQRKRQVTSSSISVPVQKIMMDAGVQTDPLVCYCVQSTLQPGAQVSAQISAQVNAHVSAHVSAHIQSQFSAHPSVHSSSSASVTSSTSTSTSSSIVMEISGPTISDFPPLTHAHRVVSWSYMSYQPHITSDMREVLVNWMVQVHESFHLLPETLYLSIHVVDKFSGERIVPRKYYQLLGAVALFMSAKHEEVSCPTLRELVLACDHAYTSQQFKNMEALLLSHCHFTLLAPTSFHHACTLLQPCFQSNLLWRNFVLYLLELTLLDYTFLRHERLDIAAAACWLVFKLQRHHAAVSNPQQVAQATEKMSTLQPQIQFQTQSQSQLHTHSLTQSQTYPQAPTKLSNDSALTSTSRQTASTNSSPVREPSQITPVPCPSTLSESSKEPESQFLRDMGYFSRDLTPCLLDLLRLVAGTPPNSPRSVRTKYATSRYLKVALFDWMQFPFVPLTLSSLEDKRDEVVPPVSSVPLEPRPVQLPQQSLPSLSAVLTVESSDSHRSPAFTVPSTECPRTPPPSLSRRPSIVV